MVLRFELARRSFRAFFTAGLALFLSVAPGRATTTPAVTYDGYYGNYRAARDHWLGIDRFVDDSGETVMLFSDYQSGVVRRLYPSATKFVMGPGFDVKSPTELTVEFRKNGQGEVTGVSLEPAHGATAFAARVPLKEEAVTFRDGDVTLAGTLMTPMTKGPHPAVILLHGSGPLTRYSFGPYLHFFTSLGLAVLIYDKRGTGASTGTLLDASTALAKAPALLSAYYPDDLANDALAAMRFLQGRSDIDSRRIGFWGSSEGGMLTTQVAARSRDVAFVVDSSGFMGPLWQTIRYQTVLHLGIEALSKADVKRAVALTDMWLHVAQTGKGWNEFVRTRDNGIKENKPWVTYASCQFTSSEQMRWKWDHILSFSPLPALRNVTCPVLAVYGEKDTSTEVPVAVRNMQRALSASGNRDVTIKTFPDAGHSLAEMPSGSRMAPGVFGTLRSWLLRHAKVEDGVPR
jgi:pimeloyl-ACP methyl ester carboxylesterase